MDETKWRWCLHCEMAFPEGTDYRCSYDGCDGYFGDIWDWAEIRELNPDYPEIPIVGVSYPMYG